MTKISSRKAALVAILAVPVISIFTIIILRSSSLNTIDQIVKDGGTVQANNVLPDWAVSIIGDLGYKRPYAIWLPSNYGDEDLEGLQKFSKLKTLNIEGTKITDSGLKSLKDFAQLEMLYLTENNFSEVAIENLEESLPNCTVIY